MRQLKKKFTRERKQRKKKKEMQQYTKFTEKTISILLKPQKSHVFTLSLRAQHNKKKKIIIK